MNNKTKKILIPCVIIIATALIIFFIKQNPPETSRFGGAPKAQISVAVKKLEPVLYQVMIDSFGTVKPRTQSALASQASGQIIEVSEQFREGGFFKKGDVLLQLDDRDHRAEVKAAQAALLTAKQGLQEEQARGRQAIVDWERLGNGEQASNLVLREPQLAAAQAEVLSAQALLEKAELDLERTKIVAPYAGRVLSRSVDLGQVVTDNTELAIIYAVDSVEIRLPIKNKDLPFMNLPEQYRDATADNNGSLVEFSSDLVGEQKWLGKIIRTEGAIDEGAQQLYVVAQINDPYKATDTNQYPIKIGQYIKAKITAKRVENALIIPNSAIYQGTYVYIVEQGILKRKNVKLAWQNAAQGIVAEGLAANDKLVLTPLGQVSSGTKVKVLGESDSEADRPPRKKPSREQLEAMAKEQGITVEELMKKHRENKKPKGDKQ
ncbi:MAG: efflux RND transporter periplasmic adaptor subunit [Pseudoalteromonas sp.]|uniref:efflux RND transporter periplasmic adaptor subunit n=1 Tax=unclassified Pseudoalteromonas TaxID=194690 RepID=UPI003F9C2D6E